MGYSNSFVITTKVTLEQVKLTVDTITFCEENVLAVFQKRGWVFLNLLQLSLNIFGASI